jgi:hypothetical protein
MKRMLILSGAIAICLAAYISVTAGGESARKETKPELKVSIAIPIVNGHRLWWWGHGHFDVVITNVSDKTIRFWGDSQNGWGTLSFNMVGPDGKSSVVYKKSKQQERTPMPTYLTLEPGDCMVIEVTPEQWDGFPAKPVPAGKTVELDLQGVFEVKATADSEKLGVWVGKVESNGMKHYVFRE